MIIEAYVLDGTVVAIEFITVQMRKYHNGNVHSMELYDKMLAKAKEKAFERINDMSKPHVVYQVNRFYLSGERFISKYFKKDLVVLE